MSFKKYKNRTNHPHLNTQDQKILEFDQMMSEWFKHRTIAIIGNASSLFNKQYGGEIDAHDIVIRINRGIGICEHPQHKKTHGNKVNIWCFNLYRTLVGFDHTMKSKIPQSYKKIQMNYTTDITGFDSCISEDLQDQTKKIVEPKQTTTGLRTLYYISSFETKGIYVYGFDWKETPTYYVQHISKADLNHDYKKERDYCFDTYFNTNKMILKQ
jgi:hypothetical protein